MKNRGLRFHPHVKINRCDQSGQALIELAISLPLLLLLLLGAAEFGRMAYMAIEVADAAKAAAQYGAQNLTTSDSVNGGILLTAQQNAPYVSNYCTSFTATAVNPTKCTCITNGTPNPTTPTAAACTAICAGYIAHVLQVTTTASCSPIFHAFGFSGADITLNGSAVQEVLN